MRKKVSILTMLALISVMVWAAVQNYTSDSVSIPTIETKAGQTITVPVSANTSHPYAAFQMEIELPYGMTPVLKSSGLVSIKKNSDRIEEHSISGNFKDNTVIIACYSGENEPISGNEGQLFSFQIIVPDSMEAGYYDYEIKNITFTTSSTAPEGVVQYDLDSFTGTIVVSEDADPAELLNLISGIEGMMNDFVYPNATSVKELQDIITDAKQAANDTMTTFQMEEYERNIWNAYENANQMDKNYQELASYKETLSTKLSQHPDADSTVVAYAESLIEQAQQVLTDLNANYNIIWNLNSQMQTVISNLSKVSLTINVAQPGTLQSLVSEKVDNFSDVIGLTLSGSLNSTDFNFIRRSLSSATYINLFDTDIINLPISCFASMYSLEEIVLPQTLETIGRNAFNNCSSLKTIEIPEGVTSLDRYAFRNCTQLTQITLPSTLTSVYAPFIGCSSLTQIFCKALLPPSTNDYYIMEGEEWHCTLYVSEMVLWNYYDASYWNNLNIETWDFVIDNFKITDWYEMYSDNFVGQNPSINVAMCDRGDAYWEPERYTFGTLYVGGEEMLSLNNFKIAYDPYTKWLSQSYGYSWMRSSAVLFNDAPMRANNVSIDLRVRAYLWNFICLPFDIKVSDIQWKFGNQPYAIYKYDGKKRAQMDMNNTWVRMTADSTLHAGVGYIWQVASSYDEATGNEYYNVSCVLNAEDNENKNNIFRKDDVVLPMAEYLSEYPQDRSWNLLGNPYPSYFASRAMNITAPFTVWNVNNQNYEAWSPRDDDYVFAPGEAFFFQRPLDQEAITFLSAGRQDSPESWGNVFFNDARSSEKSAPRYVFNLTVSGNEQSDRSRFVINADAALGYEMDKDASKFASMTNTLQLYTIEQGVHYAINERPLSNGEVKLGMTIAKKGTYTLNVETKADNGIYVIDRVTGAEVLLGEEGYVFESEAGTFDNRFVIRLGAGEATGISELKSNAEGQHNFYRMDGVRIQKPQKGVYIENGKKVVVK